MYALNLLAVMMFGLTIQMNTTVVMAVLALVAGIAIFVRPRLLGYIVGGYLVVVGTLGLISYLT